MILKKFFLVLFVGLGFIACSDDNNEPSQGGVEGKVTYVSLSVSLPGKSTQKALPEDYNPDGDYEGNDGVQTLDIYMQSADGTIEAKRFQGTDISSTGTVVAPSQPFRTTSGTKTIYVVLNNPNPLGTTITTEDELVDIDGLAQIVTSNGTNYDVITMTGKSGSVYIEPDITAQNVNDGANRISVEVERVASRAIVTTTATTDLNDANGVKIGTISNVTYSIAQGANKIHWIAQATYDSWGYDYVPILGEYVGQADTYYEYADLFTPTTVPTKPVAADGYKSLEGKFLFENTHEIGDRSTTGYRKGNTAYVLVRAKLTPEASAIADGGTLTNGTFYVGQSDGNIYSTKAAAQAAVQNQKVAVYTQGKMLYYAWLNPDDLSIPLNSPVIRNNIYHVNITGFKQIGYNWNPLYPEDPDTATPENPDPKPGNPDEPEIPIDPIDPLTPEQTYMTVEITALNWTVHSYDIEL
jgi:hypothetical protein